MNPFSHIFAPLHRALDEAEARSRELRKALPDEWIDDTDESGEWQERHQADDDFAEDVE